MERIGEWKFGSLVTYACAWGWGGCGSRAPLSPRANKFKFGRNGERTVNANLWAAPRPAAAGEPRVTTSLIQFVAAACHISTGESVSMRAIHTIQWAVVN